MEAKELEAIRERVKAATPGPWVWEVADATLLALGRAADPIYEGHVLSAHRCGACANTDGLCLWPKQPDAEVIAHAPTDIAALLAEVDRLRAELAQLKAAARGVLSLTGDETEGEQGAALGALAEGVGDVG